MTGSVTINSSLIQGQSGQKTIGPLAIAAVNSVAETLDLGFSSATTIATTPPPGATGVCITPPTNNQIGLTLKGVSGDTGIPLGTGVPTLICFANTVQAAAFSITSAAAISGVVELSFF